MHSKKPNIILSRYDLKMERLEETRKMEQTLTSEKMKDTDTLKKQQKIPRL